MRPTALILAALLWAGAAAAPARAQSSSGYYGPYSVYGPGLTYKAPSGYYGPYSVYGRGLTVKGQSFTAVPTFTSLRAQTSVSVPDGGEALVAGNGTRS